MERSNPFFRGSELPRLALLAAVMLAGWAAVWHFAHHRPPAPEPPLRVESIPEPVAPDESPEFETVTDRTPMSFRDNAAYAKLLEKARERTAPELAQESRRDVFSTHLWERPERYRGVPVHLLGTALRILRFESKLSKTGWLYEAWITTPDARKYPYNCVFEEAPRGLPIGVDVSERVVFNGYFLKILKYQAGDAVRGAPVLVGKLGWEAPLAAEPVKESNRVLFWSMVAIGAMFLVSLLRWVFQLFQYLYAPRRSLGSTRPFTDEIPPADLQAWVESQGPEDEPHEDEEGRAPSG
ncbi:hypothetical protein [Paludisphaera borealis]|uniref:Uncharacterized protein n=1 Tax=Paludisphaera borealis TaxID=1387353 RepID=A0A1U7CYV1_9BACT|nr:hypothetical protein [Paludisphaera borealis]APW64063.1 hypothetical protein BSF38_05653 [Paludisphaera borealis]